MHVIIYHHEHQFNNAACEAIIGPYSDLATAYADLMKIQTGLNAGRDYAIDGLFHISEDGTYLGGNDELNPESVICDDIWSEVWAEIVEVQALTASS